MPEYHITADQLDRIVLIAGLAGGLGTLSVIILLNLLNKWFDAPDP